MAQPTAQTDRDLASISEARSLVRRAKEAAPVARGALAGTDRRASSTRWRRPSHRRPKRSPAWRAKKPATASSPTRSRKTCSPRRRSTTSSGPMKTVGVVGRLDDRKVIEIAEPFGVVAAIVPSTNPDLDRDLQDPDRDQSPLPDRHQPASLGGPLHYPSRRDHERGGARARVRRTAPSTG